MAITFVEKRRRLKYLFSVLVILILITVLILWRGFFAKEKPVLPPIKTEPVKKIEIDDKILKHPLLEKLQLLETIPPFEGEVGRENPFLPY